MTFFQNQKAFAVLTFLIALILFNHVGLQAQEIDINKLSKDEILELKYEQLLELSIEDLIKLSDKMGVSVDELLNMKMQISSKKASTLREQPNIVTVITEDEIKYSGARDMMDVLYMVPGFFFGNDAGGVLGIGLRAGWGHEGKILIMIDGIELNELYYSGYQFANHINIEAVKRVEIIRGPGSSIYGGFAELGVINIITKKGQDMKGLTIAADGSYLKKIYGRKNVKLSAGYKLKDFDFGVHAMLANCNRWDGEYYTLYGTTFYAKDDSAQSNARNVNAFISYKNGTARFFNDNISVYALEESSYQNEFKNNSGEIFYEFNFLKSKLKITPKLSFKKHIPWYTPYYDANLSIFRTNRKLDISYDYSDDLNLSGGIDHYMDKCKYFNDQGVINTFYNDKDEISFGNISAYAQGLLKTYYTSITLGGRYEKHNVYGESFAPRLGLNIIIKRFHTKLLFSKAFRTPVIGNINFNPDIKPEETYITEFEAGYKISKAMFIRANFFDYNIDNSIIYFENKTDWGYINGGSKTGAKGVEVEYNYRTTKLSVNTNYSFYTLKGKWKLLEFASSPDAESVLGVPTHKATITISYRILQNLNFSTSFMYLSKCESFFIDDDDHRVFEEQDPCYRLNAFLNYKIKVNDMNEIEIGAGVHDILDDQYPIYQPYRGYSSEYPSTGREILLRIRYNLSD